MFTKEVTNVMDSLFDPTAWGSPVGLGLFLLFLGGFIFLLSLADRARKDKK